MRVFAAGMTLDHCFEMLAAIRQKCPTIPIWFIDDVCQLAFNKGIDAFYARCVQVGVSSLCSSGRRYAISQRREVVCSDANAILLLMICLLGIAVAIILTC
ncbi:MAG: hypothetical protein IGNPGNKH_00478 [Sodalis sp. Ffu]|nr:MAG: hypothetical protein IGNPGNKH_00478 [Sodalis sp. Ffu]